VYFNQRWAGCYFGPLVGCPLSAAQQTTEMIADQQTGKNSRPIPLFCILAYFKKYFKAKK
jgi:hypothetical protein